RDMMPDPAFYNECLRASFDELKAATIDLGAASAADAPPKTTRPAAARKKKPAARKAATSRGASAGA
ncbi:MAG: wax ester/triacylglycerol synthase family O-acyltransferase, partial [Gammaproteobacteria bacterium]|nr:wax ester/triacylglycerol synthase family O-acyltransferase [Gammaproteobacteria bacterium]